MTGCRTLILAATAVVVATGCRRGTGAKVTLRYRPPAGAEYHYALEQRTSWTMEGAAGPAPAPAAGVGAAIPMRTRFTVKEIQATGPDTTVVVGVESTFPGDPVSVKETSRGVAENHTVRVTGALTGERVYSLSRGIPLR